MTKWEIHIKHLPCIQNNDYLMEKHLHDKLQAKQTVSLFFKEHQFYLKELTDRKTMLFGFGYLTFSQK